MAVVREIIRGYPRRFRCGPLQVADLSEKAAELGVPTLSSLRRLPVQPANSGYESRGQRRPDCASDQPPPTRIHRRPPFGSSTQHRLRIHRSCRSFRCSTSRAWV